MRVATDIGGTFTDLVAVDEAGRTVMAKSHTTPPNFEEGVIDVNPSEEINSQLGGRPEEKTVLIISLNFTGAAKPWKVKLRKVPWESWPEKS